MASLARPVVCLEDHILYQTSAHSEGRRKLEQGTQAVKLF